MVSNDVKQIMSDGLFSYDDFEQAWADLNSMYEQLKFSDPLSDEQRIKEYKYVHQQLKKYIGSKRGEVLACDNVIDMVNVVEQMILKQREYGDTRADIVYNFMRDHWLTGLYNVLSQMAVSEVEDEEDE